MFKRLFTRSRFDDSTHDVYDALVAAARQPALYTGLGVPDSLDGRFDLTVLHAILTMRRLRSCGQAGAKPAQALFDLMFADFDRSLRELGVGDLKVGKRIKQMAQAFYGRARSYGLALDAGDDVALGEALRRNLYGTREPEVAEITAACRYIHHQEGYLAALPCEGLVAGRISFASPLPTGAPDSI